MDPKIKNMLSYELQEKSEKLIKYKKSYDDYKIKNIRITVSVSIFIVIFFFFIFQTMYKFFSLELYLLTIAFLITALTTTCKFIIIRETESEKRKNNYEKLRIDIITSSIDNMFKADLCKHQQSCLCKEEYLRYMKDEYNIDLIFK